MKRTIAIAALVAGFTVGLAAQGGGGRGQGAAAQPAPPGMEIMDECATARVIALEQAGTR